MEKFIAIDNVCAWPNLTLMPNGDIVATIFNQPTHGGWEGDVDCWISRDDGRTFLFLGRPAPHEAGTNRMNVSAGLTHKGNIAVIASGWTGRSEPGVNSEFKGAKVLSPMVCISSDGGKEWFRKGRVKIHCGEKHHVVPFGDIIFHDGKALGACFYGGPKALTGQKGSYYYWSRDGGKMWKKHSTIQEGDSGETALVTLPGGKILAAVRTVQDQHLQLYLLAKGAKKWTDKGPVTLGCQHPGNFLLLQDGTLLITYGIRNKGLYGIGARFSSDYGETWQPPILLAEFENEKFSGGPPASNLAELEKSIDGGYPSSVQVNDGTIVTAFYCNSAPTHNRYHMGILRWRPDEI